MLRSKSWEGGLTTNSGLARTLSMARRRRGRSNYKQIKTGTVDLGTAGAQIHLAKIMMLDHALKGAYLNNVQFSVQTNSAPQQVPATGSSNTTVIPAYTFYLSYEPTSWSDGSVFAVYSTPLGGGNGNLTCKRAIKTNEDSDPERNQGPIHVWAECTDITTGATGSSARVTLTAWGRMILLQEDF